MLSADALLSLFLIMMILGALSTTSENLKGGITSLVGWYERSNVANNMLDVLLKTPGVPENWSESLNQTRVPGLRLTNGEYVDYSKVEALMRGISLGEPSVIGALWNLSNHHNFELMFSLPNQSVHVLYTYTPPGGGLQLAACSVAELGNYSGSPVAINASSCPRGEFDFTHSGVPYDSYTNPYYVCVQGNVNVGNNFAVRLGRYLAVNGSLNVGSGGWLSSSGLYVTGDTFVGNGGYVENVSGDAYVGGDLTVGSSGYVDVSGNLFVYGSTTVQSTGYLIVGGSMYSLNGLNVYGNGNVNVGGDLYAGSAVSLGNGANVSVGGDLYINGPLGEGSGTYLSVGGSAVINGGLTTGTVVNTFGDFTFVNGSLSVGSSSRIEFGGDAFVNGSALLSWSSRVNVNGTFLVNGPLDVYAGAVLGVSDGLYVNGSLKEGFSSATMVNVNGSSFVNGNMTVEGTNVFKGNLTVNGNLLVDWGARLVVYGDLYVSGKVTLKGQLVVYGNVYEYSTEEAPIVIESGGALSADGWVYVSGRRTWYAFSGTGRSVYSYDFTGYRYVSRGGGRWREMDVEVTWAGPSYYITIGRSFFILFIPLWNLAEVGYTFEVSVGGNGELNLPPEAGNVFSYNATIPQVVNPIPPVPAFYYPPCTVSQSGSSTSTSIALSVENLSVSYEFPGEGEEHGITVAVINGTLVTNQELVERSKSAAPWIQYAEAKVPVSMLIYERDYRVSGKDAPKRLYAGRLTQGFVDNLVMELPDESGNLTMVSTFSGVNYTGYSLFLLLKNGSQLAYGVEMAIPQLNYSGVPEGCRVVVNGNDVIVPLRCFVPEPKPEGSVTFSLWLYETSFSNVTVVDAGDMRLVMKPIYQVAVVRLWVWGG